MKKIILSLGTVVLVVTITGCASKMDTKIEPNLYHSTYETAPKWVFTPDGNNTLSATGSARITQMGLQFALDEAENSARVSLARHIEVKVSAMNQTFNQITGIGAGNSADSVRSETSRTLAHQTLVGVKRTDVWISPEGEVWVKMLLSPQSILSLKTALHSAYKSAAVQSQQLQAKEALKTMDEQIEKLGLEK